MPTITQGPARRLQSIVRRYAGNVCIPPRNAFKKMSDNDLWCHVVLQVVVVGNSGPAGHVRQDIERRANWWKALAAMSNARRRSDIHSVLRRNGVRYCSAQVSRCRKTAALVKNYKLLAEHGGPRAYFQSIKSLGDEHERMHRIASEMSYIKDKSSRDLLIEIGMVRDAIALDVRILNILRACGVPVKRASVYSNGYSDLEEQLRSKVCEPLGIEGALLDRVFFQRYEEIKKDLGIRSKR